MKRAALLAVFATAAVAVQAQSQPQPQSFVDRARVQSVEPQYENVAVPRQECRSQWVDEARPVVGPGYGGVGANGYGGVLIGGVAGGLLGNQIGKGHGREAATAAGAVLGALAGDRVAGNYQPQYQPQYERAQREVRSCRAVNDMQQRLTGYRVEYTYAGRQYTTFTREQPGSTLPVRVSVAPAEEREYYRPN